VPDEQPATCGEGLAATAVVPERIAAFLSAMGDLLKNHTRSLDVEHANARLERDAYEHLVREQCAIASNLSALAAAMRGYGALPPAPHDERVLVDETSIDVFAAFIAAEEEVLAQLQQDASSHRAMLRAMKPK